MIKIKNTLYKMDIINTKNSEKSIAGLNKQYNDIFFDIESPVDKLKYFYWLYKIDSTMIKNIFDSKDAKYIKLCNQLVFLLSVFRPYMTHINNINDNKHVIVSLLDGYTIYKLWNTLSSLNKVFTYQLWDQMIYDQQVSLLNICTSIEQYNVWINLSIPQHQEFIKQTLKRDNNYLNISNLFMNISTYNPSFAMIIPLLNTDLQFPLYEILNSALKDEMKKYFINLWWKNSDKEQIVNNLSSRDKITPINGCINYRICGITINDYDWEINGCEEKDISTFLTNKIITTTTTATSEAQGMGALPGAEYTGATDSSELLYTRSGKYARGGYMQDEDKSRLTLFDLNGNILTKYYNCVDPSILKLSKEHYIDCHFRSIENYVELLNLYIYLEDDNNRKQIFTYLTDDKICKLLFFIELLHTPTVKVNKMMQNVFLQTNLMNITKRVLNDIDENQLENITKKLEEYKRCLTPDNTYSVLAHVLLLRFYFEKIGNINNLLLDDVLMLMKCLLPEQKIKLFTSCFPYNGLSDVKLTKLNDGSSPIIPNKKENVYRGTRQPIDELFNINDVENKYLKCFNRDDFTGNKIIKDYLDSVNNNKVIDWNLCISPTMISQMALLSELSTYDVKLILSLLKNDKDVCKTNYLNTDNIYDEIMECMIKHQYVISFINNIPQIPQHFINKIGILNDEDKYKNIIEYCNVHTEILNNSKKIAREGRLCFETLKIINKLQTIKTAAQANDYLSNYENNKIELLINIYEDVEWLRKLIDQNKTIDISDHKIILFYYNINE